MRLNPLKNNVPHLLSTTLNLLKINNKKERSQFILPGAFTIKFEHIQDNNKHINVLSVLITLNKHLPAWKTRLNIFTAD